MGWPGKPGPAAERGHSRRNADSDAQDTQVGEPLRSARSRRRRVQRLSDTRTERCAFGRGAVGSRLCSRLPVGRRIGRRVSGPDLYIAPNDNLPKEARAGLLKDVSSLIPTLTAAPYNTSKVALDASTVDGKLYEIPESMKAIELMYNNSVITTPPVSTADWLTNAKKLGWVYGANGGGSYYLWGLFSSFGGTIMDATTGKCTATTGGGVAAGLKWLADMKAAGMHFYQNDGDAKADLISGKIAGFIEGPWQSADLSKALGAKLSVVAGPTGPGGAWAPLTAPDGYYVNAGSPNADLAVQFALQMLLPANEQLFANYGHLPANTTLQPTDPIAQSFAALMPKGFARPTLKQLDNYWGNFGNALVAVIDKGTDPTKAVADACAAMDKANGIQ